MWSLLFVFPCRYLESHVPVSQAYHLSDIFTDLLNFSAHHLVIGGRLVYWLPIYRSEWVLQLGNCKPLTTDFSWILKVAVAYFCPVHKPLFQKKVQLNPKKQKQSTEDQHHLRSRLTTVRFPCIHLSMCNQLHFPPDASRGQTDTAIRKHTIHNCCSSVCHIWILFKPI